MRLIDADAYAAEMKARQDACKEWLEQLEKNNCDTVYIHMARQALTTFYEAKLTMDKMPPVDAVEVVRCKDCKHWEQMSVDIGVCHENGCDWLKTGYCSNGKRKDGGV